ncbi:MAG: hypothetical protein AAB791_01585 [Patescibacteria group bacterium]
MLGLSQSELKILKKLSTPIKIQDFLDALPVNWGDTYMSPRRILRENKAHCMEGALLAGLALWINGEKPLLLDLKAPEDEDHVVALYRRNNHWGAISKTNHAALRFRDPVYKTIRELALSYFHEYFNNETSKKALRSHSNPFNLKRFGFKWVTSEKDLDYIAEILDFSPHFPLFPKENLRFIRLADIMEQRAGRLTQWPKK